MTSSQGLGPRSRRQRLAAGSSGCACPMTVASPGQPGAGARAELGPAVSEQLESPFLRGKLRRKLCSDPTGQSEETPAAGLEPHWRHVQCQPWHHLLMAGTSFWLMAQVYHSHSEVRCHLRKRYSLSSNICVYSKQK